MEISNKTLAMLLVAAIAVSLFGTIFSLNKLGSLSTTGYATTDTGTATVFVNTTTSIKFALSSLDWGSGVVNTSGGFVNCSLDTDGPNSLGCIGFNTLSSGFVLENDGNLNISVNLVSNATAAEFIGGSTGGGPMFMYKVSDNETASCNNEAPATYTDVNTSGLGTLICSTPGGLDYNNSKDSLMVDIFINIPDNSPLGQKTARLTATAS